MKRCIPLFALCWLLFAMPAQAVNYCVDSNLSLATSLAAATASNADDQIRLKTGTYGGTGAIDLQVHGTLTISGGWGLSCTIRSDVATSTITGVDLPGERQEFQLTQDANDLELLGLVFDGWNKVILSGLDQQFGPPNNDIRVRRSRFTNSFYALYIDAGICQRSCPLNHAARRADSVAAGGCRSGLSQTFSMGVQSRTARPRHRSGCWALASS